MKKTFIDPEIEIIVLTQSEDILTASGALNPFEENETPDW